jgi:uncharacterized protein YkwD
MRRGLATAFASAGFGYGLARFDNLSPSQMSRLPDVFTLPFVAIVSALVLAACGGSGGGSSSTTSATSGSTPPTTTPGSVPAGTIAVAPEASCDIAGFGQAMLDAVNQARATGRACGTVFYPAVAPLDWNTLLAVAAAGHSTDMANNNYFSHTGLDGRNPNDRIGATGYQASYWGENIYAGGGDVAAAVDAWLNSPGHCANIMNSHFKDIGAACAHNSSSTYGNYWTQDFAAPR